MKPGRGIGPRELNKLVNTTDKFLVHFSPLALNIGWRKVWDAPVRR